MPHGQISRRELSIVLAVMLSPPLRVRAAEPKYYDLPNIDNLKIGGDRIYRVDPDERRGGPFSWDKGWETTHEKYIQGAKGGKYDCSNIGAYEQWESKKKEITKALAAYKTYLEERNKALDDWEVTYETKYKDAVARNAPEQETAKKNLDEVSRLKKRLQDSIKGPLDKTNAKLAELDKLKAKTTACGDDWPPQKCNDTADTGIGGILSTGRIKDVGACRK